MSEQAGDLPSGDPDPAPIIRALEICNKVGIPLDRRANDMTDDEVLRVRELIDRDYTVEGDLRRSVAMNAG